MERLKMMICCKNINVGSYTNVILDLISFKISQSKRYLKLFFKKISSYCCHLVGEICFLIFCSKRLDAFNLFEQIFRIYFASRWIFYFGEINNGNAKTYKMCPLYDTFNDSFVSASRTQSNIIIWRTIYFTVRPHVREPAVGAWT